MWGVCSAMSIVVTSSSRFTHQVQSLLVGVVNAHTNCPTPARDTIHSFSETSYLGRLYFLRQFSIWDDVISKISIISRDVPHHRLCILLPEVTRVHASTGNFSGVLNTDRTGSWVLLIWLSKWELSGIFRSKMSSLNRRMVPSLRVTRTCLGD